MHEYYFANYRLLVDDAISNSERMDYLTDFSRVMPATHTFTVRMGDEALLTPLMGQLATEISFYHLKNLPNKEATELTRDCVEKEFL